jgi:hypothetical protein
MSDKKDQIDSSSKKDDTKKEEEKKAEEPNDKFFGKYIEQIN